ncbi:MAG: hypothetical protein M1297_05210 [Nitrospirae bacterium]|jgi:tetratricopeptide (TPR) repeat protein|nr:hypothetical protein [Nitrospirota bacterium]
MSSILNYEFGKKFWGRKLSYALIIFWGLIVSFCSTAAWSGTLLVADSGNADDTGQIVHDIRTKKTRNEESLNNLALKYGLVQNRSVNASLKNISLRLSPYFDHPEFRLRVVILDRDKVMAYLLNSQTLVLTRGMVYSGLLENTDQVAGVLAYLLAEKLFGRLAEEEKGFLSPTETSVDNPRKKPVMKPILYAALAMVQAGYHYQGIIDAVSLLGKARKDPTLQSMGNYLLGKKRKILRGAAFFFEGQTAVLVHHNMTAIYDLSRFLSIFPLSVGGHFLLGQAYYQSFAETRPYSLQRFLFLVDPVPILRTQETPLDIGALDAAESEWDLALKLSPAYTPALNGKGRILLLKGDEKGARSFFRKADDLAGDSPWYQWDYALSLIMGNHVTRGERLLNKSLRKVDWDPRFEYDLAVWDVINGRLPASRKIFRKLSVLSGWRFLVRGTHPEIVSDKRQREASRLTDRRKRERPFFLDPGETMENVQKKLGLPKSPPVEMYGRTIWFYSGRGIRLIFHGKYLYYAIFEKKWDNRSLGGFNIGKKYDPQEPGAPKPSWVVPFGRSTYLVFKKSFGYVAVTEKDDRISRIFVSVLPPNTTVSQDGLKSPSLPSR